MGRIKNKDLYPVKENPIQEDYFIGTDSENADLRTVVFNFRSLVISGEIINASSNYTAKNADFILADSSSGDITISLPPVILNLNNEIEIKKISLENFVIIDGNDSELIEDDLTLIISNKGDSITLKCNAIKWYII